MSSYTFIINFVYESKECSALASLSVCAGPPEQLVSKTAVGTNTSYAELITQIYLTMT